MYSRKGIFGRPQDMWLHPPSNAKIRPVAQVDFVPTFALLLGIPVPFNSLGAPIEEAFIGPDGNSAQNLAQVSRLAALRVERYQSIYSDSTRQGLNTSIAVARNLWETAIDSQTPKAWAAAHASFVEYQLESLAIYKSLWTAFD